METVKKDSEWKKLEKKIGRVIKFDPSALEKDGQIIEEISHYPYAYVTLEYKGESETIRGAITHRVDFLNLVAAFRDKNSDEEILLIWDKSDMKFWARPFFVSMPGIIFWKCHKGAYDIMHDDNYKPELQGEARFLAERPIQEWKPGALK